MGGCDWGGCVDAGAGEHGMVGVALVEEAAAAGVEEACQPYSLRSHPVVHFSGHPPPGCPQAAHSAGSPCYLWWPSASWLVPAAASAGTHQSHSQHTLGR